MSKNHEKPIIMPQAISPLFGKNLTMINILVSVQQNDHTVYCFLGKSVDGIWVREIRKLNPSGHQTSIITSNYSLSITEIGLYIFSRWCQENYFKYATQNFGIDCLISNTKNSIPETYKIQNPEYVSLHQ